MATGSVMLRQQLHSESPPEALWNLSVDFDANHIIGVCINRWLPDFEPGNNANLERILCHSKHSSGNAACRPCWQDL